MAGKNQVTLTLAGDNDQLKKAFAETEAAADAMAKGVGESSKRIADEVGQSQKRVADEVRSSAEAYDRAAEATDTLDTRAMGFRDTVTGVQDSVLGFSKVLKGDFSADALFVAGAGVGDLASGFTNLLIPGLKSARDGLSAATTATKNFVTSSRGAMLTVGGLGAALAVAFVAYQSFVREGEAASIQVRRLERDLKLLNETGHATGDAARTLDIDWQDATRGLDARTMPVLGSLAEQVQKVTTGSERLDSVVLGLTDNIPGFTRASGEAADKVTKLEDALVGMLEEGSTTSDVMAIATDAADQLGITTDDLIARMPELRDELSRVRQEHEGVTEAMQEHIDALQTFTDMLRAQTDPIFAVVDAEQQRKDAIDALNEATKEHGEQSEEARLAALDLAEAEIGLAGAIGDAATASDGDLVPALRRLRDDGKLSKDAYDALIEAIGDTKSAAADLDGTRSRVDVDIVYNYGSRGEIPSSFGPRPRQHGGPLAPLMLVGEQGPELIAGQQVIAHQQTMSMLQGMAPAGRPASSSTTIMVESGGGSSTDQAVAQLVLGLIRNGAIRLSVRNGQVMVA